MKGWGRQMRFPRSIHYALFAVLAAVKLAAAPVQPESGNPIVLLQTGQGPIRIELDAEAAPQSVANFLGYVRAGFYDGVIFDRTVPGFIAEAGGRTPDGAQKPIARPVPSEAANGLKNLKGTVGLAREADINSGADHFYINLKDNPHLDHSGEDPGHYGYTVFGKVVSGMEYAEIIGKISNPAVEITSAQILREPDTAGLVLRHEQTREELSDFYNVDKIYKSMTGPQSTKPFHLEDGPPELLWITGYAADVVGDANDPTGLDQFMCHSNLDLDPARHLQKIGAKYSVNPRLFTLSQGQMDIEFPPGFGVPIVSDETLSLTTQVLNLNYADCGLKLRHRTRIRFVRDREMPVPMQPLYQAAVYGLKVLSGADGRYGIDPQSHDGHDMASCLPGQNAASFEYKDAFNRVFTGHWVVPPGREVNRTAVDAMLNIPEDTTIHYIAVHLHPFAESLELYDKTAGATVWKSAAKNPEGRIGLENVEKFSSAPGIPLYHDHHYELVSTYNNTSKENQDSMAVMFLYVKDHRFEKPALAPVVTAALPGR